MFCANCGAANPDDGKFCARCGNALQPGLSPSVPAGVSVPARPMTGAFVEPPTTSGKAVASLLFGFLFFFLPAALAAVVLGHLSLTDIRKSAGRLQGHGIAVGGLVLGYFGICMIPFILIIAAIAIPNLLRSRMAMNEASAVGSLRTIDSAALSYSATYGNGFPPSLDTLSGVGTSNCDHAGLIDGVLASGQRSGYLFTYQATTADSAGAAPKAPASGCTAAGANGFTVSADPITPGTSGQRSFYMDQTGIIRYETNGAASANSTPLE